MQSPTQTLCRECYKSPVQEERRREQQLLYRYDLSLAQYNDLLNVQNHRCALCGEPFERETQRAPAVDHDHSTGLIRGIVHFRCNRILGVFNDNPVFLERAALYLRTARTPYNAHSSKGERSKKR